MSSEYYNTLDPDRCRANLLDYARKAYRMLPPLTRPRILDIGRGTGVATLELARISDGTLVALDIDQEALDKLMKKRENEGLTDRITIVHASMMDMNFPPNSFDIIWSEGAIIHIGFKQGLEEWKSLLVSEGYLVIHDSMWSLNRKIKAARSSGYHILGQFELSATIWWQKYYEPLKKQIDQLRSINSLNKKVMADIEAAEREIRDFDERNDYYSSVFIIMQKMQSKFQSTSDMIA